MVLTDLVSRMTMHHRDIAMPHGSILLVSETNGQILIDCKNSIVMAKTRLVFQSKASETDREVVM